jgi:hypothetical protein
LRGFYLWSECLSLSKRIVFFVNAGETHRKRESVDFRGQMAVNQKALVFTKAFYASGHGLYALAF